MPMWKYLKRYDDFFRNLEFTKFSHSKIFTYTVFTKYARIVFDCTMCLVLNLPLSCTICACIVPVQELILGMCFYAPCVLLNLPLFRKRGAYQPFAGACLCS